MSLIQYGGSVRLFCNRDPFFRNQRWKLYRERDWEQPAALKVVDRDCEQPAALKVVEKDYDMTHDAAEIAAHWSLKRTAYTLSWS